MALPQELKDQIYNNLPSGAEQAFQSLQPPWHAESDYEVWPVLKVRRSSKAEWNIPSSIAGLEVSLSKVCLEFNSTTIFSPSDLKSDISKQAYRKMAGYIYILLILSEARVTYDRGWTFAKDQCLAFKALKNILEWFWNNFRLNLHDIRTLKPTIRKKGYSVSSCPHG